jgi:predicted Zn-dependent protease with MMP-like domain
VSAVTDWAVFKAPTLDEIDALAQAEFKKLPPKFRELCGELIIRVTEFADDDVLKELGAESPFDILGLFTGIGLSQGGFAQETGQMPNMVHLYRRPLIDYWAEHDETFGALVSHVLIHEIGHHFGLSDADMDAIEAAA